MTTAYERFKWDLLGDLVFEDAYRLGEVFVKARTEQHELVPHVEEFFWTILDSLEAEGSIQLFRPKDVPEFGSPPVDDILSSRDVRSAFTEVPFDPDASLVLEIWVAATEEGRKLCEDPPQWVREMWGWELTREN